MRRLLVPTCLLLGGALLVPALLSVAHEPALARTRATARPAPLSDARACKPQPPVAAVLEQTAVDGDVVELSFSIAPHAEAGALSWVLVLPPGAELLEGPAAGQLAAGAGTGALSARVRLPSEAARVALEVQGSLADGAEPLRTRRTLSWGVPPAAARELVAVGSGGAPIARTPARHREGR